MSLLHPPYWSKSYFSSGLRERTRPYPPHLQPLLSSTSSNESEWYPTGVNRKRDRMNLMAIAMDAQLHRKRSPAPRRALLCLRRIGLRDLDISLLLLLLPYLPGRSDMFSDLCQGIFNAGLVSLTPLTRILFDAMQRPEIEPLLLPSLGVFVNLGLQRDSAFGTVIYTLVTLLRTSTSRGLNDAAVAGLKALYHTLDEGTVPFGLHIVKRCFEVGRTTGEMWPLPVPSDSLWGSMEPPYVEWGLLPCEPLEDDIDFSGQAAIAANQLLAATDTGSGLHFGEEEVREALREALRSFPRGSALPVSVLVPVIDATRRCTPNADSTLVKAVLELCTLACEANAMLLASLGLASIIRTLLSPPPRHHDPMASVDNDDGDYTLLGIVTDLHPDPQLLPLLLPPEPAPPSLPNTVAGAVHCALGLLRGLAKEPRGSPAVRARVLEIHLLGWPPLLASAAVHRPLLRSVALEALSALCTLDAAMFADFCGASEGMTRELTDILVTDILSDLHRERGSISILTSLLKDPRARAALPKRPLYRLLDIDAPDGFAALLSLTLTG